MLLITNINYTINIEYDSYINSIVNQSLIVYDSSINSIILL